MTIGGREYEDIVVTDAQGGVLALVDDKNIVEHNGCKAIINSKNNTADLPKSVNILGVEYKVKVCGAVDKFNPAYGQIDYVNQTIRIDSTLAEHKRGVVLVHEILHGILEGLGMDDLNENENAVQCLATALYCVWRQNPKLRGE